MQSEGLLLMQIRPKRFLTVLSGLHFSMAERLRQVNVIAEKLHGSEWTCSFFYSIFMRNAINTRVICSSLSGCLLALLWRLNPIGTDAVSER